MNTSFENQLTYGAETIVPRAELQQRLESGKPLRVKLGLDPTAAAVTLGWTVVLRKLRQFQDAGHTAVLIVGDFTARVGDPSGRNQTRPRLEPEVINRYAEQLLGQFQRVLSPEGLEIRHNSEWLANLDMEQILSLTSRVTVAQMLERADFSARMEQQQPISLLEFMYPLLQAYDSVAVEADVELGGADQLWNLMMGREIQGRMGQAQQVALTMPLLVGTDGKQKMSQSLGNYIGIVDPPSEMFGKTMSIPDSLLVSWLRLLTALPPQEVDRIEQGLADGSVSPADTKRKLGRLLVSTWWGEDQAGPAEAEFDRVFRDRQTPDDIPEAILPPDPDPIWLPRLLTTHQLTASNSEARRLINQGAVKVGGEQIITEEIPRSSLTNQVLQVGKRRFLKLTDPPTSTD